MNRLKHLVLFALFSSSAAFAAEVIVDFDRPVGTIKPVNGVDQGLVH